MRPGERRSTIARGLLPAAAAALVAALATAPPVSAEPGRPHSGASVPNEVLVRFRVGVTEASITGMTSRMDARTIERFPFVPGLELVRLGSARTVSSAVGAFDGLAGVAYAQPNWISHVDVDAQASAATKTPNDPRYGQQWNWPAIDAPAGWNLTTGKRTVVVGDIDTGLDYRHVDLRANVWKNTAECGGTPGVDDDGNGYVDDCHGIDTIDGDSNPMDDNDHGTHTGGTIGAVGDNGTGVTGLDWRVQILPCKSHDAEGNGSVASIIACFQYMVTEKAAGYDIVATNNSYGGCPEACGFDRATKDGIAAMGKAGILYAVAAGNDGSNNDLTPAYPANYFLPNVIAVAATDGADHLASFSDDGARTVMVGAPGVGILSTVRGNAYASFSGTSMATPHVAALAGLIHADDPGLSIYQIRNLIVAGGDGVASLAGTTVSGRRIDAYGSLTCSGSKVFGMLRPLENVSAGKLTVAALNIDCADPAGAVSVTIKPGNITLRLGDGGKKGDQQPGDGIYSALWNAAPGSYTLRFSNGSKDSVDVS